jgi:hypothetical protein
MKIMEIWADTGEVITREPTTEEAAQAGADQAAAVAAALAQAELDAASKAARVAAIAHAKSLGFTDAMIAVMYPNLTEGGDTSE